jgi:hypothetical protein
MTISREIDYLQKTRETENTLECEQVITALIASLKSSEDLP